MEAVRIAVGTGSAACLPRGSIDIGALAWVQGELRRSLQAAARTLRRAAREADALAGSDVAGLDPAVLRSARRHLHQSAGALELLGLPAGARVLRAGESLVQRWSAHPAQLTPAGVAIVERALFALLDYVARLLAGIDVSPLALFAHYRAVQEAAGAERVHPADLWTVAWRWLELPDDAAAGAAPPDTDAQHLLEEQLLALMKSAPGSRTFQQASRRMGMLCAQLGAHAQAAGDRPRSATLWKLAAAVFEAQVLGLLRPDVYGKRVASRLLQQFRVAGHGDEAVDERLARDLLFFCAQSDTADEAQAPRLAAVRRVYGLAGAAPVDYSSSVLGRVDPVLVAQARKRVAAAKESWAAVAAGDAGRHGLLVEQFALVGDSLQRLLGSGDTLAPVLQAIAARIRDEAAAPRAELAMEVATSLLYLEAALEDPEFDPDSDGERARVLWLAERVGMARSGSAGPLEPWIEALYRRVSDRQTLGSVVQELRTALGEVEKSIDRFVREPEEATDLQPVQARLQSLRGVLAVLGLDEAAQAVRRMRADLDRLLPLQDGEEAARQSELLDRLAGNLGALGFLIDLFGVQPEMAKSVFVFDAGRGVLAPVSAPVAPGAPAQPRPPAAWGDAGLPRAAAVPATAPAAGGDDVRAVFLEEAREMLSGARETLADLAQAPDDPERLGALRRAFHTLKGSSRMVGLAGFGEAAAQVEEACKRHLADGGTADEPLRRCCARSLDALTRWIDAVAQDRQAPDAAEQVAAALADLAAERAAAAPPQDMAADAGDAGPEAAPPAVGAVVPWTAAEQPLPLGFPLDMPSAADLDLSPPPAADAPLQPPSAPARAVFAGFDLSAVEPPALPAGEVLEWPVDLEIDLAFDSGPDGWQDGPATAPAPHWILPLEAPPLPLPAPTVDSGHAGAAAAAGARPTDAGHAAVPSDAGPLHGAEEDASGDAVEVGPLRVARPLFDIYVGESDSLARRLEADLFAWADAADRSLGEETIALAHSIAGSSATVGYAALSGFARLFEEALAGSRALGHGTVDDVRLFVRVARQVRQLVRRFAEGFLDAPPAGLAQELAARHAELAPQPAGMSAFGAAGAEAASRPAPARGEAKAPTAPTATPAPAGLARPAGVPATPLLGTETSPLPFGVPEFRPLEPRPADTAPRPFGPRADAPGGDDDDEIDAVDAVDSDLFPVFEEEGRELLPQLAASLREWARRPDDAVPPAAAMRTLHTLKGSARLAGALRLGDLCHRLEARIERLLARSPLDAREVEALQARADALALAFDALRAAAPVAEPAPAPAAALPAGSRHAQPPAPAGDEDDSWMHFAPVAGAAAPSDDAAAPAAAPSTVRVRTPLLDRLVSRAGEVSIARTRIETDMQRIKGSLADLTDNFGRLRQQLRDLELLAELEVGSRIEAARTATAAFDPLELDRYTAFQEVGKMMAETVNDVLTVQRTLQRAVEGAEDTLAAQGRLTRDMQDDLLRTRMVEFDSRSERLYRVVRQAAKESGKQVRLHIYGGSIEIDRGLLDRMTPAFEHLLRNCVVHGIESPQERVAAGKEPAGAIVVALEHVGNEVAIEFRDDGAGLDLERIRARGVASGLVDADTPASDAELAALIFRPGFTTTDHVTELAGRGVGMDVVYSEVNAVGGRIETATAAGQGTSFRLLMPLTTAVTQVLLLRAGTLTVAVPSTLVEVVRRVDPPTLEQAYLAGSLEHGGAALPFHWLGALLEGSAAGERPAAEAARLRAVVVVRSSRQRVALHVDEVLGKHEAVVKNLGPQLARVPGLVGITLLVSGEVALIYNPVTLASRHGEAARARTMAALAGPVEPGADSAAHPADASPLVLVVDDSITVRRVTQRLLEREGFRVALARDGLDALELMATERPRVVLSDIEMPRMDGFSLVRRIRADARLAGLPVIVVTSRSARKHRDLAAELGVDDYLGKPYSEDELLALVARHAAAAPA